MRVLGSIVFVLVFCLSAGAQDRPDYLWRSPTAAELLQTIIQLPELSADQIGILDLELRTRYTDEIGFQDYELVHEAYDHLYAGDYFPPETEIFWLQAQIAAWLNSHQIDLELATEFHFRDISVPVTAYDLNGDGEDEWLLDLQQNALQGFVFVGQNADGQYQIIRSPLPFEPYAIQRYTQGETNANWALEHFGDLNEDGQTEVVILYTLQNDTYENTAVTGRYYILTWKDHALVDLGGDGLLFQLQDLQTTWTWRPTGARPMFQLQQTRTMRDNWECEWEQTTIFEWDGSLFTETQVEERYPDTSSCAMRHAENAMQAGDYARAIQLYEQSDARETDRDSETWGEYRAIRRAMAYVLTGEPERGIEILRSQQNRTDTFHRLPELIDTLLTTYDENPTAFGICQVAYDFFWFNPYYVYSKGSVEVGHTVDNRIFGQGMYAPPPANPAGAGCDAPGLFESLLAQHRFTTTETPIEQLASLGIMASSVYRDDLNGDGIDEWLISVGIGGALFFVPDGSVFHVSSVTVSAPGDPDDQNQLLTIQLPGDAGPALLRMSYGRPYVQPILGYGIGGGPGECPAEGNVSVWRFVDNTLERMLSASLCETLELAQVVDHLPTVSQIRGWGFSDIVFDYVPVQFVWNASTETYALTSESLATLTPVVAEESIAPPYQTDNGTRLLLQQEYERIVDDYHQAMLSIPDATNPLLLKWRYLAALALEALDRPQEALAAYIAIHEAVPDSAWGMLASLHIEVLEDE